MFKRFLLVFFLTFLFFIPPAQAQENFQPPKEQYYKGEVIEVKREGVRDVVGHPISYQILAVRLANNTTIEIEVGGNPTNAAAKKLAKGDSVVVLELTDFTGKKTYSVWDRHRLDFLPGMLIGFFLLVVFVAGIKGIRALLGMGISIAVLFWFIVPQILAGKDPLLISIVGSIVILVVSIYLSHGLSKKTTVAVIATFLSLLITGTLAYLFVTGMRLSGFGSETAYTLNLGKTAINLQGLLLGGIIIGALGVLDDITTTQSAAIFELAHTDNRLTFEQLAAKGYSIGKEHVASLINTLVLAYAGASLSLFILFILNPSHTPVWVILNSESIMEEIVRTIAGSTGLILAVPITTVLAAFVATKQKISD